MSLTKERIKGNKMRKSILERDGYKCAVCGSSKELEVHHKHALYLGGKSEEDNLITLCSDCHTYAPETGKEENDRYIKERNRVVYEQLMTNKDINSMTIVAFVEFIKDRLDVYVSEGIITEEQKNKILFYETTKLY